MKVWCDSATCWIIRAKLWRWWLEKTREDLDAARKLNLALVRLLEIVGEAANRTPADERAQYAQIPWAQIVGLRNRLIHGYDSVATGIEIYFNRADHQGRRVISVKSA